ncbi:MAG TPA: DUF456 domain-containing protein [Marmoricola sp.]|nr:DUF456 domain-containing protein [Nocardioidaceae bacterium]HRV68061.1 DUF456 domain-containing protein [Marmoricola sp.]
MSGIEVIVAIVIAVGLAGILIPVFPGPILIVGALAVWASEQGTTTSWIIFVVATLIMVVGWLVKYLIPGKSLRNAGIPNSSLLAGGLLGIIGFFVIPVIGFVIGFVLGIYLAQYRRVGHDEAWPSTIHALKAVGVSILIEFSAASLAALVWLAGAIST